ncbi:hypothetical protein YDYSG_27330 [Paenibacillus tyrfis]|nr:hypothetical protein YDYSG_27330 [Paenibacillus tyrfis]
MGEPTVHQHIVGGKADKQCSFDHVGDSIWLTGKSFYPALIALTTLGQMLVHLADAVHKLSGRKHDKVDRRKAETIRPAKSQHIEAPGKAAGCMIEHAG